MRHLWLALAALILAPVFAFGLLVTLGVAFGGSC